MRLHGGIAGFVVHRKEKRDKEDVDKNGVYEDSSHLLFWLFIILDYYWFWIIEIFKRYIKYVMFCRKYMFVYIEKIKYYGKRKERNWHS